ncbi:hypothetical protein O3P69_000095 [Scylla paramamosain]|uniref:Uncharacterized protein n=1 Tax=Scylla paramamosain TaxID=85552 RepID=A0AAW0UUG1_SCYPA
MRASLRCHSPAPPPCTKVVRTPLVQPRQASSGINILHLVYIFTRGRSHLGRGASVLCRHHDKEIPVKESGSPCDNAEVDAAPTEAHPGTTQQGSPKLHTAASTAKIPLQPPRAGRTPFPAPLMPLQ